MNAARRILNYFLIYTAFRLLGSFFLKSREEIEIELKTDEGKAEEEEEDEEIEIPDATPDDGWFVALGIPHEIERDGRDISFNAQDPEWKDIVALNNDKKGLDDVRGEQA